MPFSKSPQYRFYDDPLRMYNAMLDDIGNCHNNGIGKLIGPYGWDSVTNRIIAGYKSVMAAPLQHKEATLHR